MIPAASRKACLLGLAAALLLAGCARPPSFTPVEGTVLLNDKPLPNARVEFVPDLSRYGAEYNASGITDENGRFTLSGTYKGEPGGPVGKCRVVVTEAPAPADTRGMDGASQERFAKYVQGLKNRPIPETYGAVGSTPLTVDVKPDQKDYAINLKR